MSKEQKSRALTFAAMPPTRPNLATSTASAMRSSPKAPRAIIKLPASARASAERDRHRRHDWHKLSHAEVAVAAFITQIDL